VDDAPAEGSKYREPRQKSKRGKKGKKPHREAREKGTTTVAKKPLLLTQLDGALDRPLEALGFFTTC
jgi:hypothetical protein